MGILLSLFVHTSTPQGDTIPIPISPYLCGMDVLYGTRFQQMPYSEANRGSIPPVHEEIFAEVSITDPSINTVGGLDFSLGQNISSYAGKYPPPL